MQSAPWADLVELCGVYLFEKSEAKCMNAQI